MHRALKAGVAATVIGMAMAGCAAKTRVPPTTANAPYRIGRDDVLDVNVWRDPDLSRTVPVRPEPFVGVDAMPWCQWKLPVMWPIHNAGSDVYHSPMDTIDRIDFAALTEAAARHCDLLEKLMA
jgi:hypothetical protein